VSRTRALIAEPIPRPEIPISLRDVEASNDAMLLLPYLRSWYDDETFGSWLDGVRLHNGEGAWRCLLKTVGYSPENTAPTLAARYDQKIADLLGLLGITYETAILNLTTIPFWLSFDALPLEQGVLPGTQNLPKLPGAKAQGRFVMRGQPDRPAPRWCAMCLIADCAKYGEPYWHRSHQLPNIFVCWKHYCVLFSNCPSCGYATGTTSKEQMHLPRLRCGCGYDLRRSAHIEPISPAYMRLIQVSHDALTFGAPLWDRQSVRSYLMGLLDHNDESQRLDYVEVLSDAFGGREQSYNGPPDAEHIFLERDLLLIELANIAERLILKRYFSKLGAPECCALLAAMDKSFEDASLELQRPAAPPMPLKRREHEDLTILRARHNITVLKGGPIFRKSYWLLRFHDSKWFEDEYPREYGRIPSMQSDRIKIAQLIGDRSRPAYYRRKLLLAQVTSFRAEQRDQPWFSNQLHVLNQQILEEKTKDRNDIQASRVATLYKVLERLLHEEKKPQRITTHQLATLAGLSHLQAKAAIKFDPLLKKRLDKANNCTNERRLVWAGLQLQSKGITPSYGQIYLLAGVPSKKAMLLKKAVMEKLDNHGSAYEKGDPSLSDSSEILDISAQDNTLTETAQTTVPNISEFGRRLYLRSSLHPKRAKRVPLNSQEILHLRKEGKTFATIGAILGVSTRSIAEAIHSIADIDPQLRKPIWHRANCDPGVVSALREKGYNFPSIASLLNVSSSTARRAARRSAELTNANGTA
jgi:hypothetical protein